VIQLAVDLVAGVDGVFTHLAGRSALEFDLVIGTQRFDHGISRRRWSMATPSWRLLRL